MISISSPFSVAPLLSRSLNNKFHQPLINLGKVGIWSMHHWHEGALYGGYYLKIWIVCTCTFENFSNTILAGVVKSLMPTFTIILVWVQCFPLSWRIELLFDVFSLWYYIWNKWSYHRGIGGIACYIRKNISPHVRLYKKDPYNQYIWIDITDINDKKPT